MAPELGELHREDGRVPFLQPTTSSLVADDRAEIGYAYDDGPFLHSTSGNGAGLPVLRIDGATTSAARDITLTAVGPNRHYGLPGTGVVVDAETSTGGGVGLFDDHVTVEWLEIKGGSGTDRPRHRPRRPAGEQPVQRPLQPRSRRRGERHRRLPGAKRQSAPGQQHRPHDGRLRRVPRSRHPSGGRGRSRCSTTRSPNTNGGNSACYKGVAGVGSNTSHVLLANNIGYFLAGTADDFDFPDSDPADGWADVYPASRRNLSSDSSATRHNVTPGGPVSGRYRQLRELPAGDPPPQQPQRRDRRRRRPVLADDRRRHRCAGPPVRCGRTSGQTSSDLPWRRA